MVIFHSYVNLPEGINQLNQLWPVMTISDGHQTCSQIPWSIPPLYCPLRYTGRINSAPAGHLQQEIWCIWRMLSCWFPWLTVNLCRSLQCLYHGISYFSDIVQWDHVWLHLQKLKSNWIAPIHKQQVQQAIWCELSSIAGGNAQGHWIRTWAIPEQARCSNIVRSWSRKP